MRSRTGRSASSAFRRRNRIVTPFGALTFDNPRTLYYLVFVFLVLGVWLMSRIVRSLLGRTFEAIRNSDELAESLGINLMRNKVLAFMLSVFYAGMAGGLYAGFVRFLGPGIAGVEYTFDMTMYMLVGGIGTLLGPLLGALAVPWLTQYLQFLQELSVPRVRADPGAAGDLRAARRRRHLEGLACAGAPPVRRAPVPRSTTASAAAPAPSRTKGAAAMSEPILEVSHLTKRWGGLAAVNDVSTTHRNRPASTRSSARTAPARRPSST